MPGIVILATRGVGTNAIYHNLSRLGPTVLVIEDKVSPLTLVRARSRRLGWLPVLGQILFVMLVQRWLISASQRRIDQIVKEFQLEIDANPHHHEVPSVNAECTRQFLREIKPQVLVLAGTRIVSEATLRSVDCPILNMHAGITPAYRGCHGAYWALTQGQPELAGTTVHLVDPGIDTGPILYQSCIYPGVEDNFATYPYLQLGTGLPLLQRAVQDVLAGQPLRPRQRTELPSRLWHHPTIWTYLKHRLLSGIR